MRHSIRRATSIIILLVMVFLIVWGFLQIFPLGKIVAHYQNERDVRLVSEFISHKELLSSKNIDEENARLHDICEILKEVVKDEHHADETVVDDLFVFYPDWTAEYKQLVLTANDRHEVRVFACNLNAGFLLEDLMRGFFMDEKIESVPVTACDFFVDNDGEISLSFTIPKDVSIYYEDPGFLHRFS